MSAGLKKSTTLNTSEPSMFHLFREAFTHLSSSHCNLRLSECAQTLYTVRTQRLHGLPNIELHAVFQATAVVKLLYATSGALV